MTTLKLPSGVTYVRDINGAKVCTGTQMGRRNELPSDSNEAVKLRLERLRFVDGDYDQWGAYWGGGPDVLPIYCAWGDSEENQVRVFVRAQDRVAAKAHVLKLLPNATFNR
jgi:hypothetical protein